MRGRDALAQMLEDAPRGEFTWVVVEQADRLARDEADHASILKKLRRAGVTVWDLAMGALEGIKRGISGYMAEHVREQFLARSADGRARDVAKGRSPHRPAYGYSLHPTVPGLRLIHPGRAEAIKIIFELYVGGTGVAAIARHLTGRYPKPGDACAEDRGGAPGHRSAWSGGTVRHILRNPIYAGMLVDGVMGAKRNEDHEIVGWEPHDRKNWRIADVPRLAIVDVAVWERAQEKLNDNCDSKRSQAPHTRFLFTGLLHCRCCGRALAAVSGLKSVYRCRRG